MIEEVEVTPFTLEVKVLLEEVRDRLLMIFAAAAVRPLITVEKRLPVEEAEAELMRLAVEVTPFTTLVRVLVLEERELVVLPVTSDAKEVVAVTPFTFEVRTLPFRERVLVLMIFTPELGIPLTAVINVLVATKLETEEMVLALEEASVKITSPEALTERTFPLAEEVAEKTFKFPKRKPERPAAAEVKVVVPLTKIGPLKFAPDNKAYGLKAAEVM